MTLLFTGFGPFGDVEYNPSWDAAQAAAEEAAATAELLNVTLEAAEIGRERPENDLIVHFGVAVRRSGVCLERYAHNWWADLGDPVPRRLVADAETALECSLPLDDLAAKLDGEADLTWRVSHDAGTYICNATLFHSLRARGAAATMFVHIPPVYPPTARQIGRALAREAVEGGSLRTGPRVI